MTTKIKFKDVSWPIKVAVVVGLFEAAVYAGSFILGMLSSFI